MSDSTKDKTPERIPKPVPVPDESSREFFEGARQGRLMIQRCLACGNARFLARKRCDVCRSPEHAWEAASGEAVIVSYVVMHQRYHPGFFEELPYPLAVVELKEGPRLVTSLEGVEGVALEAGMPMKAVFREVDEGVFLPKFTPADPTQQEDVQP